MNKKVDNLKSVILDIEKVKNTGDYQKAIEMTQKAILKYNEDYRLYEELADILIYLGEIKKAEKAVEHALRLNPNSATGNYLKGFLSLNEERYKEALKFLEKSNKLMGNNPEVLRNLGWAYTMNNQSKRGIAILKRALILEPEDKLIIEDLAMAFIGIGEIEKGNELLAKIGLDHKMIINNEKI